MVFCFLFLETILGVGTVKITKDNSWPWSNKKADGKKTQELSVAWHLEVICFRGKPHCVSLKGREGDGEKHLLAVTLRRAMRWTVGYKKQIKLPVFSYKHKIRQEGKKKQKKCDKWKQRNNSKNYIWNKC